MPDGRRVDGTVRLAAPSLNSATSRGVVSVSLPADSGAVAGGFASGEIELANQSALTAPQSAVVLRDGRSYVFSIGADNRVTRHPVTVGRRRDQRVEILAGLPLGVRIVESGGAFLSDGTPVTVAPSGDPVATAAIPERKS